MTSILLTTPIEAAIEKCFDLSRSIDLHKETTKKYKEKAIEGRRSGLIERGEHVTWEATHFFVKVRMTVKITEMRRPSFFSDQMVAGPFKYMEHRHHFEDHEGRTIMKDEFRYKVPFGPAGKLFDAIILKRHLLQLLVHRNSGIKETAECKTRTS